MYIIEKLRENDLCNYADNVSNAYPGFKMITIEDRDKFIKQSIKVQNESDNVSIYGAYNGDNLVGSMKLYDFRMNLLSTKINAGGVGLVAVNLLNKKEKVAKEMIYFFIEHYRAKGAPIALLYPFRPDFYKKMGFGFGANMYQYRIKPCNLPCKGSKEHIRTAGICDSNNLCSCYNRYSDRTNGIIERRAAEFVGLLDNPQFKVVVYEKADYISGYMIFSFKTSESFLNNDIIVKELIYENSDVLNEMMTFLHSQDDQIKNIVFNLQDENFRFILDNPTDGSGNIFTSVYHQGGVYGTGIMYRVTDIELLFYELMNHNFNNVSCLMKITIRDSFIEANNKSIYINFDNGIPKKAYGGKYDVEINIDICDFSSLIACAVDFKSLYKYGRASISNIDYINIVNTAFGSDDKPVCMTGF